MSGKSSTISNVTPAAGNLRVQTSVYGAAIPLVYGTARVSGNLLWYGGFTPIAHTTTTSSGGKGGGGIKQSTTSYTYTAAVMLALGEGPLNNVLSAWRGKQQYAAQPASSVPKLFTESFTVPVGGTLTVANGALFINDVQVTDTRPEQFDNTNWQVP